MGNAWIIPRDDIEAYRPAKRGVKPQKERLSAELDGIKAAISETKRLETE
jgi:hypothetical protein